MNLKYLFILTSLQYFYIIIKYLFVYLKFVDLQNELKDSEVKYKELIDDYNTMKNYIITKRHMSEDDQLIYEKNVSIF